jgi:predicted nuclease of restriction endonuclease-like (RecB) superfamily
VECVRGNWSLRELKRQIGSLYFERSSLFLDKGKLSELVRENAEPQASFDIRAPYVFEFLGLTPTEVMSESHLEAQLIDKLQAFLLERRGCGRSEYVSRLNNHGSRGFYSQNQTATSTHPFSQGGQHG